MKRIFARSVIYLSSRNPWHGCTKISPDCANCYVYRSNPKYNRDPSIIGKNACFTLPIVRKKNGEYKLQSDDDYVYTCFTSDFFHPVADLCDASDSVENHHLRAAARSEKKAVYQWFGNSSAGEKAVVPHGFAITTGSYLCENNAWNTACHFAFNRPMLIFKKMAAFTGFPGNFSRYKPKKHD